MSYQIAVLIWLLLIVLEIILITVAVGAVGFEDDNGKFLGVGIAAIFGAVIVGWGIWVIYPLTMIGI